MELYRRLRLPNPEEIGFRYPHQVSGGQLQRAMTAMAMSCRPDLIIFLATVRAIADEVVMKEGKVVEAGPKDEMFRPPHHEYTDLLLSSVQEMDPDWLDGLLERCGVDNIGEAARK